MISVPCSPPGTGPGTEKIQSTTDAGSLNTFGRNETEVAPISSALLRIACLVILYKTCCCSRESLWNIPAHCLTSTPTKIRSRQPTVIHGDYLPNGLYVGLVDPLPAGDRGAVPSLNVSSSHVLPLAAWIGETEVERRRKIMTLQSLIPLKARTGIAAPEICSLEPIPLKYGKATSAASLLAASMITKKPDFPPTLQECI